MLILYGVNILLVMLAGMLLMTRNSLAAYILVLLGAALVIGSRVLGYFRFSRFVRHLVQRWKDLQQSKYVTFRAHWLRKAFEKEGPWPGAGIWRGISGPTWAFDGSGLFPAAPTFRPSTGRRPERVETERKESEFMLNLSILGNHDPIGVLEIIWLSPDTHPCRPVWTRS